MSSSSESRRNIAPSLSRRVALKSLASATACAAYGTGFCVHAVQTPAKAVASGRLVGELFRGNRFDITGQDAATSLLLPSGEALWVFGDTIEGPFDSIRELDLADKLSNTAAIVPPQDASRGLTQFRFLATPDGQRPRQIVPFHDDENPGRDRVWPMHGVCTPAGIYLYYHRISLKPGVDVFDDFVLDGMGLARARPGELDFHRLAAADGTLEYWKGDQPGFGVFVVEDDGYLYLWGSLMTGMFLARVRPDSIEDLSSYQYLVEAPTGARPDALPRWASQFEPTAVLFDGVPNEMSASYNQHLGSYIAIHTRLRDNEIVIRTAPRLTGPWSAGEVAFRPPRHSPNDLFYAAKEHPELSRNNGRTIYVTFVNSATYVPQLVELTLCDKA